MSVNTLNKGDDDDDDDNNNNNNINNNNNNIINEAQIKNYDFAGTINETLKTSVWAWCSAGDVFIM